VTLKGWVEFFSRQVYFTTVASLTKGDMGRIMGRRENPYTKTKEAIQTWWSKTPTLKEQGGS